MSYIQYKLFHEQVSRLMPGKGTRRSHSSWWVHHVFQTQIWSSIKFMLAATINVNNQKTYSILHHGHFVRTAGSRKAMSDKYHGLPSFTWSSPWDFGQRIEYLVLRVRIKSRRLNIVRYGMGPQLKNRRNSLARQIRANRHRVQLPS